MLLEDCGHVILHPANFPAAPEKYGVVLQQDDLGIVFMTLRYADKLWHHQFFSVITFVPRRLTEEERAPDSS